MIKISEVWKYPSERFNCGKLIEQAWDELPDMRYQSKAEFIRRMTSMVGEHTRIELLAWDKGIIVGGIIGGITEDVHYGFCMAALLQYVSPEYRATPVYRRLYKRFLHYARESGMDVALYTKRTGPMTYNLTYTRTNNGVP